MNQNNDQLRPLKISTANKAISAEIIFLQRQSFHIFSEKTAFRSESHLPGNIWNDMKWFSHNWLNLHYLSVVP